MKCKSIARFWVFLVTMFGAYQAASADRIGAIDRIWLNSGSANFVITMDSDALDDCLHGYAYYVGARVGENKVDLLYGLALSAYHSNAPVVVRLQEIDGTGRCRAEDMIMIRE